LEELVNTGYRRGLKSLHPREMAFAQAIHIEVTNVCNLKCVMCPRNEMERPVGYMKRATFERIVAQLEPHRRIIERVALMGLGEPLLHDELEDFSRVAKRAKLPNLYTSTNAALLDEKRAERILREGQFDRIIFSVDGASKETYEKLRVGARFEKVVGNIRRFLEMRGKGNQGPAATIQILVMAETENEVEQFCSDWLPLLGPADEILVKDVDTFGGQVDDRRLTLSAEPEIRTACPQLWKDLSISWDGLATVCCKDVLYKLAVANVEDTELSQIWRSSKWEGIRKAHASGNFSMEPCGGCKEWYL
jgi:radical SAM family protein/iron-sulfur cluster protein